MGRVVDAVEAVLVVVDLEPEAAGNLAVSCCLVAFWRARKKESRVAMRSSDDRVSLTTSLRSATWSRLVSQRGRRQWEVFAAIRIVLLKLHSPC